MAPKKPSHETPLPKSLDYCPDLPLLLPDEQNKPDKPAAVPKSSARIKSKLYSRKTSSLFIPHDEEIVKRNLLGFPLLGCQCAQLPIRFRLELLDAAHNVFVSEDRRGSSGDGADQVGAHADVESAPALLV